MLILTLRTDKPEAELSLYENEKQLAYLSWQAHRELAETLHLKISELLAAQSKQLKEIMGIVIYKGPGSFTGLRIGFSVGNALADSLGIPIASTVGTNWQVTGLAQLVDGKNERPAVPEYGAPPKTTTQKK